MRKGRVIKSILTIAAALAVTAALSLAAFAADRSQFESKTFTKDGVLNATLKAFNNITVKSGANIVAKGGFEIFGDLTVEPGASFTGVRQTGDFTFSLRPGATVTGIDLYYLHKNDDDSLTVTLIPVPIADTWADKDNPWQQMNPAFQWNPEIDGWCLNRTLNGNPFHVKQYHTTRDLDWAKQNADELYAAGIFGGVGTNADGTPDYALGRPATRVQAVAMLVRLLGKNSEALSGNWEHPFTDVPAWADKYVGYAYATGLTNGISKTEFGTGQATTQQFMTFLLRALGYTDADSSSTLYNDALAMAERLGLLTEGVEGAPEYPICINDFWRADMTVAAYRALNTRTKDGEWLYERLIAEGVFTADKWRAPFGTPPTE